MPYGITQCYLPPGRGDIPAFTPAEAGTRFSDPGGMQGWVDLGGLLEITRITVTHHELTWPDVDNFVDATNHANHYTKIRPRENLYLLTTAQSSSVRLSVANASRLIEVTDCSFL